MSGSVGTVWRYVLDSWKESQDNYHFDGIDCCMLCNQFYFWTVKLFDRVSQRAKVKSKERSMGNIETKNGIPLYEQVYSALVPGH